MKIIFALFLAFNFTLLADDASKDPNDLGTVATAAKTYQHVHVTSITPLGIKCTWDGGLGLITFDNLPPELQKKFNYDPAKFKEAANEQVKHDAESDAAALQAAQQNKVREQANALAADKASPKNRRYLVGEIQNNITGGYAVYIAPYEPYIPDGNSNGSGGVSQVVLPKDPYPRVASGMVALKTSKPHTVNETIQLVVVEAGTYKSREGDDYREYEEVTPDASN